MKVYRVVWLLPCAENLNSLCCDGLVRHVTIALECRVEPLQGTIDVARVIMLEENAEELKKMANTNKQKEVYVLCTFDTHSMNQIKNLG